MNHTKFPYVIQKGNINILKIYINYWRDLKLNNEKNGKSNTMKLALKKKTCPTTLK